MSARFHLRAFSLLLSIALAPVPVLAGFTEAQIKEIQDILLEKFVILPNAPTGTTPPTPVFSSGSKIYQEMPGRLAQEPAYLALKNPEERRQFIRYLLSNDADDALRNTAHTLDEFIEIYPYIEWELKTSGRPKAVAYTYRMEVAPKYLEQIKKDLPTQLLIQARDQEKAFGLTYDWIHDSFYSHTRTQQLSAFEKVHKQFSIVENPRINALFSGWAADLFREPMNDPQTYKALLKFIDGKLQFANYYDLVYGLNRVLNQASGANPVIGAQQLIDDLLKQPNHLPAREKAFFEAAAKAKLNPDSNARMLRAFYQSYDENVFLSRFAEVDRAEEKKILEAGMDYLSRMSKLEKKDLRLYEYTMDHYVTRHSLSPEEISKATNQFKEVLKSSAAPKKTAAKVLLKFEERMKSPALYSVFPPEPCDFQSLLDTLMKPGSFRNN